MQISKTQITNYARMIAGVIMFILPLVGVVAEEEAVYFIVFAVLVTGFSIWSFVDRFRKGDLTLAGRRLNK